MKKKPQCVIFHSALQHRDFIIRGIYESKSLNTVTREVLTAIPGTRKTICLSDSKCNGFYDNRYNGFINVYFELIAKLLKCA